MFGWFQNKNEKKIFPKAFLLHALPKPSIRRSRKHNSSDDCYHYYYYFFFFFYYYEPEDAEHDSAKGTTDDCYPHDDVHCCRGVVLDLDDNDNPRLGDGNDG